MSILSNVINRAKNMRQTEDPSRIHELQDQTQNFHNQSLMQNFPCIPLNQTVYGFYELNGHFNYGTSPEFDKSLLIKHHLPMFEDISDIISESSNTVPTVSQLSNVKDKNALVRRLATVYFESSLSDVCHEIINYQRVVSNQNQKLPVFVTKTAYFLLKMIDVINAPISPWFVSKKEEDLSFQAIKGVESRTSLIRSIQWHPNCNKYAVAFKNDAVKVYSSSHMPVVLKHPKQIGVTCLAWKPHHASLIAVGCADCIIIWDTESLPVSIKPSSSCSYVLSKKYHTDIIDLQWYPKSDFLLSIASRDNQIIIWDVTLKVSVPVKSFETNGFSLSRFSPDGMKLFTAGLSTSFRIWNPINYTSEKWSNLIARCNSACWSADGTHLLFTCEDCSLLYLLKFLSNNKQDLRVVCDLSMVNIFGMGANSGECTFADNMTMDENRCSLGGSISDMCWDSSSQRLAITFKKYDVESQLNGVAIFITQLQPQFQVLPLGFVHDYENSWPSSIQFKPQFESGCLLTIGWSSGRLQHVPFYFSNKTEIYPISNLGFQ